MSNTNASPVWHPRRRWRIFPAEAHTGQERHERPQHDTLA